MTGPGLGPRVTRELLLREAEALLKQLPDDPVPAMSFGRYNIELSISVREGCSVHVRTASYFERSDYVKGVN